MSDKPKPSAALVIVRHNDKHVPNVYNLSGRQTIVGGIYRTAVPEGQEPRWHVWDLEETYDTLEEAFAAYDAASNLFEELAAIWTEVNQRLDSMGAKLDDLVALMPVQKTELTH